MPPPAPETAPSGPPAGVSQNREATLRYVPDTPFLGAAHANIELKACDASANPYLALAVVIAAGLSGIEDGLTLPEPIQEDPDAFRILSCGPDPRIRIKTSSGW